MKRRFAVLMIFLGVLLLTQIAFSGTWTDTRVTNNFSITGTTVSTSTGHGGHGTTYYRVSGSADISGKADPMDTGDVYEATMWLEASGKDVGGVPGRGNIDKNKKEGDIFKDVYRSSNGTGTILYKKHAVGSASNNPINPSTYTANSLSDSVSHYWIDGSYSSPTDLSASPYCYGILSGDLGKAAGGASLTTLTFRSVDNDSDGDSPDDGTEILASEICNRKKHCQKPFTAKKAFDHRVSCGKKRWGDNKWLGAINIWKKKKEDCPGYRWTCSPLACDFTASHVGSSESHLEEKYVDSQGNTVDPSTVTRNCGHLLSASGDHSLQASCSVTNTNGQSCTVTNFYACQSHTHTYPNARFLPLLTVRQRCQSASLGYTCSKGGYTTGRDTHTSTCPLWHRYWDCHPASVEKHKVRTCVRCSNTYQNCDGGRNPCISGLGHAETVETAAEAPSTPQPTPSPPSETPPTTSPEDSTPNENENENEEQEQEEEEESDVPEETPSARPTAVCGSGHTYFTDGGYARNRHRDRTCLRCELTYQKCSNHSSACQNTRWHTENTEATMRGECGHTYRIRVRAQHASVTCSVQNSAGDTCSGGSYYVCQSHTHIYPSRSTPTPTPSPPENSNPNNNNNEDEEEEEEEEVPAAPPAPVISYHPCGIHLTTVSGDHSLQASCSTDRTCIATSFYRCQHSSHTYPAPPPAPAPTPTPTVVCPADSWTNCGGTSSHAQTCRSGHTYYTCGTAEAHHKDRTCTRCSETYTKCSHTATSCGGTRWHTQESDPYIRGACGHQYPRSKADRHTTIYACKREGCSERLTHCQNGPEKCVRPNRPRKSHWL